MADGLYSAGDVVDKTLVAAMDVPIYSSPGDHQKPIGTVKKGQPVGIVYGWLDPDPAKDRSVLWWIFWPRGNSTAYYYAPHKTEYYSLQALIDQGVLTDKEKQAQKDEENKSWYEKLADKAIPVILISVLGAAAIHGFFSARKSN